MKDAPVYRYDKHPGWSPPWGWAQIISVSLAFIGFQWLNFPWWIHTYSGSFIIPSVVSTVLIAWPIIYVQLKVGGAAQKGIIGIMTSQIPILKGIGVACVLRMCIHVISDHMSLGYSLLYMYESLKSPQPWGTCGHVWNTQQCNKDTSASGSIRRVEEYFFRFAASLSVGIETPIGLLGHLALPLAMSWLLTCLVTSGGPRLYGWMMCVFAPLAVLSVIIFLIFGWVNNSVEGGVILDSLYFVNHSRPEAEDVKTTLADSRIWVEACNQVALALTLSHGVLPTIGKYSGPNRSKVNLSWSPILVLSLVLPNLLLISMAPFLRSWSTEMPYIYKSIQFGTLTMPAAMSTLGVSTYWSFLFYVIIYLFGLIYVSLLVLIISSAFVGLMYRLLKPKYRELSRRLLRLIISIILCLLGFLLGLPLTTHSGWFWYQLIQSFVNRLDAIYIVLILPGFLVGYSRLQIPGVEKHLMGFWFAAASFVLCIFSILQVSLGHIPPASLEAETGTGHYIYPTWAIIIGWLIASAPLLLGLIFGAIHAIATRNRDKKEQSLRHLVVPGALSEDEAWSILDAYSTEALPVSSISQPALQVSGRPSVPYRLSDNPERTYM